MGITTQFVLQRYMIDREKNWGKTPGEAAVEFDVWIQEVRNGVDR